MAVRLTRKRIEAELAATPKAGDRFLFDETVPGLAVRLRGGRASFVYQYKAGGRSRRVTLGAFGPLTVKQARDLALELYRNVRRGDDPAERRREARRRGTTFAEAAELYLQDLEDRARKVARRGKASTAGEFRRLLDRCILPRLGTRPVAAISLEDIEGMHRAIAGTPAQANRALTVTSAVLRHAERRRLRPIGSNPCGLVERFRERPVASRLSLAELERLGAALREAEAKHSENRSALLAIRLLALTGLRRSEVLGHAMKSRRTPGAAGLRWGDVDLEGRLLTLQDAKTGGRVVPLGSAAVELLQAVRPADTPADLHVCPGAREGEPYVGIDKVRRRLFAAAEIDGASLHSLRRTFASVAADVGLGPYMVGALLGHARQGVTGRYVIPAHDPLREAAETVSRTISAALEGRKPAAVVSIAERRSE